MNTVSSITDSATSFWAWLSNPDTWVGIVNSILPFIYGILLIILTSIIAKVVSNLLMKVLNRYHFDKHLNKITSGLGGISLTDPIVTIVYYLIWLFALPIILTQFGFQSLTAPINNVITNILDLIPRLLSAAIIFGVLYIAANALRSIIIQVLNGLNLKAIMEKIGLGAISKTTDVASLLGNLVFWILILIGVNSALETIGLPVLSNIATQVLTIAGNVLFGAVIILIGVYIANTVEMLINQHSNQKNVAMLAKIAIIILIGLSGVEQMGLQTSIITGSFQIIIAALAAGFALAMGLGAKDTIGKLVSDTIAKFK